jgi:hypothetical protein
MFAFMAGPTMQIGHQVAYLYLFILPHLLQYLFQAAYLTDPKLPKATYNIFICESPWRWPLRGRRSHSIPKRLCVKKKPSMHFWTEGTIKAKLQTYLVLVMVSAFKVGCCVEEQLRELLASHRLREVPSFPRPAFTALSSPLTTPGPSALIPTPILSGLIPTPCPARSMHLSFSRT